MRTSYKKNRPFDFKLIDLVEPHAVLYKRTGLSNYEAMKAKTEIWAKIAKQLGREVDFCLMRWNNLHYQFRKEFRRSDHRGSTWPYLKRLCFLADSQLRPQAKPQLQEVVKESSMETEQLAWDEIPDQTYIIEEIIEEEPLPKDQVIQEEIVYEEEAVEQIDDTNFLQLDQILAQFKSEQTRQRVERRLMAFLLKCQLCALVNEPIDDLVI